MKKLLLPIAFATVMFIATGPSEAAKGGGGSHGHASSAKGTATAKVSGTSKGTGANSGKGTGSGKGQLGSGKGIRFAHGIYYRGHDHNHWGARRFDSRYGCECYWDPYVSEWYYWCEPDACYYPVSYCPYQCYTCSAPVAVPVETAEPGQPDPQ